MINFFNQKINHHADLRRTSFNRDNNNGVISNSLHLPSQQLTSVNSVIIQVAANSKEALSLQYEALLTYLKNLEKKSPSSEGNSSNSVSSHVLFHEHSPLNQQKSRENQDIRLENVKQPIPLNSSK